MSSHRRSISPKRMASLKKYKSKSPKRTSSVRKSKSPMSKYKYKSPSKSMTTGTDKVKFYDLIAKKPFYTSDYKIKTRTTKSQNGKRLVTYYVAVNPTPKKDGGTFENWKIVSNEKA